MEKALDGYWKEIVQCLKDSNDAQLSELLTYSNDKELNVLKSFLQENQWLLCKVCELGLTSSVQSLLELNIIDIRNKCDGWTPLQVASKAGHVDIVSLLLEAGAEIRQDVWKNDSEFYLATYYGHFDVALHLVEKAPHAVRESEKSYSLLYAACLGGFKKLAMLWLRPDHNVNSLVTFPPSLDCCENLYPLFAACKGKHLEVASFLVQDHGACIRREISETFVDITTKLITDLCKVQTSNEEQVFRLSKWSVEYLMPQWFQAPELDQEEEESMGSASINAKEIIILAVNTELKTLAAEVLWHLPGLVTLDISQNPQVVIEEPIRPAEIESNRLVSLDMSNCELETVSPYLFMLPCIEDMCLAYNRLSELPTLHGSTWKCERLKFLNVSFNSIKCLPSAIQVCTALDTLNASHNKLVMLCPPWACPLKFLDLSSNELTTFPANAHSFWRTTLRNVFLQENLLEELTASLITMENLRHLNVANNKIAKLPAPDKWRCKLFYLNLSNNEIGIAKRKSTLSRTMSAKPMAPLIGPSFEDVSFRRSLAELYLANNSLCAVPKGVECLPNLSLLDLSRNPDLKAISIELGRLHKLLCLGLTDITVEDKALQVLIDGLNEPSRELRISARDIIKYLERKRQLCRPANVLKVVILARKKRLDEKSLLQQIISRRKKVSDVPEPDQEGLLVARIPGSRRRMSIAGSSNQGQTIVWEFPDMKFTSVVLPCFLTLNTVYVLQLEVTSTILPSSGLCLKTLSEKVSSIQAFVLNPKIFVAVMFPDGVNRRDVQAVENDLQGQKFSTTALSQAEFFFFSGSPRQRLQQLDCLWSAVELASFEEERKRDRGPIAQREVPAAFLQVWERVMEIERPPKLCTLHRFMELAECTTDGFQDCLEPGFTLEEFLIQSAAILHYDSFNQHLTNCVFLDPAWLFGVLTKFLKSLSTERQRMDKVTVEQVKMITQHMLPDDYDYFPALIALMESFNIGFRMQDALGEAFLVIPSLLSKYPPNLTLSPYPNGLRATRLYRMPIVPPSIWSQIISQLVLALDRLSGPSWKLGISRSSGAMLLGEDVVKHNKSFMMKRQPSLRGLRVVDKNIQYWRTGILVFHDQGYVVVEEVDCCDEDKLKSPGILVTVQTNDCNTEEERLNKLSVMGIVKDELEEVLETFNPKFADPTALDLKPYVLCAHCHRTQPLCGTVDITGLHFTARDCAQVLLRKDIITCQGGPSSLHSLVPELLFLELPPSLRLNFQDLELRMEESLGRGVAGQVVKGSYNGLEVAVKMFHQNLIQSEPQPGDETEEDGYENFQRHTSPRISYPLAPDQQEEDQRKISSAFTETRREVGILSKLQHPSLVAFIGVCVRPHLLIVMELAVLGSLREELKRRTSKVEEEENSHSMMTGGGGDKIVSETVFSKDLTYKIILQISSGLSHLHSHSIIFRDLKPDNILLMSLEEDAPVNVKLSDYGISKFTSSKGISGLSGTVGYMAPEVMAQQAYTEKVDIFSLGVCMVEILTGIPPLDPEQSSRVSDALNDGLWSLHLQGYKIQCHFPYLDTIMHKCRSTNPERRPDAKDVVKMMASPQVLLLHDSIWLEGQVTGQTITCIHACETNGRWNVWVCEQGSRQRRYVSVYDVQASCFSVWHREMNPGPPIVAMLRSGSKVWMACKDDPMLYILSSNSNNKFDITSAHRLRSPALNLTLFKFRKSERARDKLIFAGLQDGSVQSLHYSNSGRNFNMTCLPLAAGLEEEEAVSETLDKALLHEEPKRQSGSDPPNQPVTCLTQVGCYSIAAAYGLNIHLIKVSTSLRRQSKSTDPTRPPSSSSQNSVSLSSVCTISLTSCLKHGSLSSVSAITSPGQSCGIGDEGIIWCCLDAEPILVCVDVSQGCVRHVITVRWCPGLDMVRLETQQSPVAPPRPAPRTRSLTSPGSPGSQDFPQSPKDDDVPEVFPPITEAEEERCPRSLSSPGDGPSSLGYRRPPIPPRGSREELSVAVSSLVSSPQGDVIMVGAGKAGLFPLVLAEIGTNAEGLPMQVEVMRHQMESASSLDEDRVWQGTLGRSRGYSSSSTSSAGSINTVSAVEITKPRQVVLPQGDISDLLTAGDKFVSIYNRDAKVKPKPASAISARPIAQVFSPPSTEGWSVIDDIGREVTKSGEEVCNAEDAGQCVSDLAVWDFACADRLATIDGYKSDFVS